MGSSRRVLENLERVILLFEGTVFNGSLSKHRKVESMLAELRELLLTMRRIDSHNQKKRFWLLSRRAVVVSVKIARMLSTS
jgi:hypothetical protein